MDAELAERGVDGGHLGGEVGGDLHALARGEDVELVGVEDQPAAARADRLPEILGGVGAGAVDVDHAAVLDGAEADDAARPGEADMGDEAVAQLQRRRRPAAPPRGARAAPRR